MTQDASPTDWKTRKFNCDQEAWLIDRLWMFARTVRAITIEANVHAEQGIVNSAVDGVIHGTADEIVRGILGMDPEYANLRKPIYGRTRTMGVINPPPSVTLPGLEEK